MKNNRVPFLIFFLFFFPFHVYHSVSHTICYLVRVSDNDNNNMYRWFSRLHILHRRTRDRNVVFTPMDGGRRPLATKSLRRDRVRRHVLRSIFSVPFRPLQILYTHTLCSDPRRHGAARTLQGPSSRRKPENCDFWKRIRTFFLFFFGKNMIFWAH